MAAKASPLAIASLAATGLALALLGVAPNKTILDALGGTPIDDVLLEGTAVALLLAFVARPLGAAVAVLPFFWVPEDRMAERVARDRVPYDAWVRAGFIEATPGNITDHRTIQRRICELRDEFEIVEIAFDRWGSVQISTGLQDEGFTMAMFLFERIRADVVALVVLLRCAGGWPDMLWRLRDRFSSAERRASAFGSICCCS